MKKVLAITVALMIAAIVITPALGYTDQIAGNQSYTVTSSGRVPYSISTGVPAQNLTQETVTNTYSISTPSVQSTRVPYTLQQGVVMPYSFSLVGVTNPEREGYQTEKQPAVLGKIAGTETTVPTTEAMPPAVNETPVVSEMPAVNETVAAPTPTVEPMFTIEGMVFDDLDGNGVMNDNETGLADWTVNLEQPAGMVIMSANTTMDGKFAFNDLVAGEYTVAEVLQMGWMLVSPVDGKFTVNITNESMTNLAFANQLMPAVAENVEVPSNVTAPDNATAP